MSHYLSNTKSLQDLVDTTPDLVSYFRNNPDSPHARNRPSSAPLPAEITNWREEQRAWRETAVLFDQSHHMPELFLKGSDSLKLLNRIGINTLTKWGAGRAKQFIGCNHRGEIIGESMLHWLAPDHFELISGMQLQDWVHFNAETGGYDVTVTRDLHTAENPGGPNGRTNFRFGMDGPNAEKVFQDVVEGVVGDIPFFQTRAVVVAGVDCMVLRHGMAGHKGVELSGPYAQGQKVRDALMKAGEKYGLKPAGRLAYFSTAAESGWWAYPLPAIYTDPELKAFRQWLPATSWGGLAQLAGSLVCETIDGYYVTPWDTGVNRVLNFDHDFIGREALAAMVDKPHRKKVTLVWNQDDLATIRASIFHPGLPYKYIELPMASYGFPQADAVHSLDGRLVGMGGYVGCTVNEGAMLSLGIIDSDLAQPGTQVTLTWGEPGGGTSKPNVERHRQFKVRCTVAPAPFAAAVNALKYQVMGTVNA